MHECKCIFGVWSTIPLPGPTCRADFRSSREDGGSNGPGVDDRVMGGRRWGVRARDGCRMGDRRKDDQRKDDRRTGGRRTGGRRTGGQKTGGRRKGGRRKGGRGKDGCRRDGCRWDVRERDGRRRERGRSGRGSDDGDNDRRGGRHTLHLKRERRRAEGGGREEGKEGQLGSLEGGLWCCVTCLPS